MIQDLGSSDASSSASGSLWLGPGRVIAVILGFVLALPLIVGLADVQGNGGIPAPSPCETTAPSVDRVGNVVAPVTCTFLWLQLSQRVPTPPPVPAGTCPVSPAVPLSGSATGAAAGTGPIYAVTGAATIGLGARQQNGLRSGKLLWIASPAYRGPALIRGGLLDGRRWSPSVIFDGDQSLRFDLDTHVRAGSDGDGSAIGWRYLPSTLSVAVPGCYAFEIEMPDRTTWIILATSP